MRLYKNYLLLNCPAARLLDLREGSAVSIQRDDRDGYVYIANCSSMKQSYPVAVANKRFLVRSAKLCRKLANTLEGYGTYKVCTEDSIEFMGHKFYNIFKRKYGKD